MAARSAVVGSGAQSAWEERAKIGIIGAGQIGGTDEFLRDAGS
jgi:hypothetical protein